MILILGGSASGKSEYAERLAAGLAGPRVYLATMEVCDRESEERVAKHRRQRQDRGFRTVECARGLDSAEVQRDETILLECLSNLTANEMFLPDGTVLSAERTAELTFAEILRLAGRCRELIIVGNRLTQGGTDHDGMTLDWLRAFSELQNRIAAASEEVIVLEAGIPRKLKS